MAVSLARVVILAGSNGSGKTTSSQRLLAETLDVKAYVNADVIARGLAGFDPDSAASEAARIMLERLKDLAQARSCFAFETTLAGRAYIPWLRQWKAEGYLVDLYYFWLRSPDLSVARVAQRVRDGGHDVPEKTIRQRYDRSMSNFFLLYRELADTWRWYDNSAVGDVRLIASGEEGIETVSDEPTWRSILAQVNESDAGRELQSHPADEIDVSVCKSMQEAALRHARLGNAVSTWSEGKVVWLAPQEVLDRVS